MLWFYDYWLVDWNLNFYEIGELYYDFFGFGLCCGLIVVYFCELIGCFWLLCIFVGLEYINLNFWRIEFFC